MERGMEGEDRVSAAVQSALTDGLYIACHFSPQEYWGSAEFSPGR